MKNEPSLYRYSIPLLSPGLVRVLYTINKVQSNVAVTSKEVQKTWCS